MKIAYLLEYPIDLPGGAQMSTQSLCQGLVEYSKGSSFIKYEPVVICPELLKKQASDYPFRIITYPMGEKRISNLLMRRKAFSKILKEEKPDIVHIQMPESLITYGICGMKASKKGGPKLVFTDRGLFYGYRKHSMMLMKHTLKKADLMLTTTEFNRKMWLEGTKIRPIDKIANTISDKFAPYDEKIREQRYKERGSRLTLGLAGRICEEKNWPFAVKLIELMAKAGISFDVRLVLSVFEKGDDEKVSFIVDGIKNAIGREHLHFGQDYTQEQMQDYYYDVDIFLMTSQFESFGKAAVEAMSRGCAVLSTDVGGLSEVISKKENLYTEDTPQLAVDYVRKAAADSSFLKAEQEFFLNRFRDNYSQDKCISDHIAVYEQLMKSQR